MRYLLHRRCSDEPGAFAEIKAVPENRLFFDTEDLAAATRTIDAGQAYALVLTTQHEAFTEELIL